MHAAGPNELVLLRHAAADHGGRLCGRTDMPVKPGGLTKAATIRSWLPRPAILAISPARRCRQTAQAIWPDVEPDCDERLWEQDFGAHEGLEFQELPDLGSLPLKALAEYRAPQGESFFDLLARVEPAAADWSAQAAANAGPVVLIAHAGIVRAFLAALTGMREAALAFEVECLAITRLRCHSNGISVHACNLSLIGGEN